MEQRSGTTGKHNATLDLLLVISSFFVVLGHVPFPEPYGYYLLAIGKFSFPFFFMVSGWHLYRGNEKDAAKAVIKSLVSTLKVTLVSVLVVSIFNIVVCLVRSQHPFQWFINFFTDRQAILYFFTYNYAKFLSPVMWYLFAYIYVLVLYYLVIRLRVLKTAYFLIIPLILINLIRAEVFDLAWYRQGNWLFTGLPFVLLGTYLCQHKQLIEQVKISKCWISVIAGVLITIIENYIFGEQIIYIGNLFSAFGLFVIAVICKDKELPSFISKYGYDISLAAFILHCSFRNLLYYVFELYDFNSKIWFLLPFIIFVICSGIGMLCSIIRSNIAKPEQA